MRHLFGLLACLLLVSCASDEPQPPPPPTLTHTPEAALSLDVRNASTLTLCGVYLSPTTAPDWGSNQLTAELPPQQQAIISPIAPGTYDLRLTDCADQTVEIRFGVPLAGEEIWTIERGTLRVENGSSTDLCAIYARAANAPGSGWGRNRLAEPLPPGTEVAIPLIEASWDLRATACDPAITPVDQRAVEVRGTFIWSPAVAP